MFVKQETRISGLESAGNNCLPQYHMKPLQISLNTVHSGCKPSSSCHLLHTFSKSSCPYSSPPSPPHFYRPTPNHLHSNIPNAWTISIYLALPPRPRSEHSKDCTRPHFASYPSETLHTSTSPSYVLLSPGYADFQPSSPMFQSHMSTHSGHRLRLAKVI